MRKAHVEVYLTKGKPDDRLLTAIMHDEPLEPRQLLFSRMIDIDGADFGAVRDEYEKANTAAPHIPASESKVYLDFIETVVDGSLVDALAFCGHCNEMIIKMPWDRSRIYCTAECRKSAQASRNAESRAHRNYVDGDGPS
jgi:hypothetical protein